MKEALPGSLEQPESGGFNDRAANEFRVIRGGPLLARGDLVFADEAGTILRRETAAAFCRCGQSGNKPFCDGSHARLGFPGGDGDPNAPPPDSKVTPLAEGAPTSGPVTVVMKPTGSLRLVGPLTVIDADGRRHAGGRVSICRCGASKTKPWCDNTHRDIDFRAD